LKNIARKPRRWSRNSAGAISSGGDVRRLEGNLPLHRLTVLEFPTLEAAKQFYDSAEYQPIQKLRLASTRSDVVLVQGYSG
jgi:uncharacterized protein (DUF1330 family)